MEEDKECGTAACLEEEVKHARRAGSKDAVGTMSRHTQHTVEAKRLGIKLFGEPV